MPSHRRRLLRLILLDTAVFLGLMAVFTAVNHAFAPSGPQLSDRIFRTPEPQGVTAPSEGEFASLPAPDPFRETGEGDVLDLKRLRAKDLKVTVHQVKRGENFWTIRNDYNIDLYTLIGANPDLPFIARVDQRLFILSEKGVLHPVGKGETLESIAELYKSDVETLKRTNGISWWKGLKEGDVLFLPEARPIRMTKEWNKYFDQRGMFGVPFASWGKGWTSAFGIRTDPITGDTRKHKGLDFKANYGEKVFAAGSGKVIFAGVSGGYGNLIQIAHGKGYITYYGHLAKIHVKTGQHVARGTLIGLVGATGRVTGPHLHFEVRKDGKAVDPLPLI